MLMVSCVHGLEPAEGPDLLFAVHERSDLSTLSSRPPFPVVVLVRDNVFERVHQQYVRTTQLMVSL